MVVVADTSPLNYLVLIDEISILPYLYKEIVIPEAVVFELLHPHAPDVVAAWVRQLPPWIKVVTSPMLFADAELSGLDVGEQAAIALVQTCESPTLLLIDDAKGKDVARLRHVPTIGTMGVLALAAEQELIDLSVAFDRLRQTSFRFSERIAKELLRQDRQKRTRRP